MAAHDPNTLDAYRHGDFFKLPCDLGAFCGNRTYHRERIAIRNTSKSTSTYSDPSTASELASALPDFEESINAGTRTLVIERRQAERLIRAAYPLQIQARSRFDTIDSLDEWPSCHRRVDDLFEWARALAAANPDLVELIDIGDSGCKAIGGCKTPDGLDTWR